MFWRKDCYDNEYQTQDDLDRQSYLENLQKQVEADHSHEIYTKIKTLNQQVEDLKSQLESVQIANKKLSNQMHSVFAQLLDHGFDVIQNQDGSYVVTKM